MVNTGGPPKENQPALSGSLAQVSIAELFSTMEASGRSGSVRVTSDLGSAVVWFNNGHLIDAEMGRILGEAAVFRVMGLHDGAFELHYAPVRRRQVIHDSVATLIAKRAQRTSRWEQLVRQAPDLNATPTLGRNWVSRASELDAEHRRLLRLIDGRRRLLEIIDESGLDAITALEHLISLHGRGLFEVKPPPEPAPRSPHSEAAVPVAEPRPSWVDLEGPAKTGTLIGLPAQFIAQELFGTPPTPDPRAEPAAPPRPAAGNPPSDPPNAGGAAGGAAADRTSGSSAPPPAAPSTGSAPPPEAQQEWRFRRADTGTLIGYPGLQQELEELERREREKAERETAERERAERERAERERGPSRSSVVTTHMVAVGTSFSERPSGNSGPVRAPTSSYPGPHADEPPARPEDAGRYASSPAAEPRGVRASVPPPPPAELAPLAAVGRYEILSRIAKGGMGAVYLCRVTGEGGFRRLFAMKVLHRHLQRSPEHVRMFLEEARIAARLHHPNVVSIVDAGTSEGRPFLVMDYVEGCSLAELLKRYPNERPPEVITSLMLDALDGLQAAHALTDDDGTPFAMVHCDVSPHNVLVGLDGRGRLSDFGIARVRSAFRNEDGWITHGKPAYLSPEQVAGRPIDQRSDVFSAGVVLYNALTGEQLFEAPTPEETMSRVLKQKIEPPSQVGLRPPACFDAFLLKALERDPNRRFQSSAEMLVELRKLALAEDLLAPPTAVALWVSATFGPELEQRRLGLLDASRQSKLSHERPRRETPGDLLSHEQESEPPPTEKEPNHDATRTIQLSAVNERKQRRVLIAACVVAVALAIIALAWPSQFSEWFTYQRAPAPSKRVMPGAQPPQPRASAAPSPGDPAQGTVAPTAPDGGIIVAPAPGPSAPPPKVSPRRESPNVPPQELQR